jgi:hypothetical protein
VKLIDAERAAEAVQNPATVLGQVEALDLVTQAVVDEAVG